MFDTYKCCGQPPRPDVPWYQLLIAKAGLSICRNSRDFQEELEAERRKRQQAYAKAAGIGTMQTQEQDPHQEQLSRGPQFIDAEIYGADEEKAAQTVQRYYRGYRTRQGHHVASSGYAETYPVAQELADGQYPDVVEPGATTSVSQPSGMVTADGAFVSFLLCGCLQSIAYLLLCWNRYSCSS